MAHYIDGDRLKAELEKERQKAFDSYEDTENPYYIGREDFAKAAIRSIEALQNEQPKVDYNEFEKLFSDFCERNKGHHITSHDACMWFWELGLNARKED